MEKSKKVSDKKTAVILMGPACVGKGSVAKTLVGNNTKAKHLNMRGVIQLKAETDQNFRAVAEELEKQGKLISCNLIHPIAADSIYSNQTHNLLVLDGFGRTEEQAQVTVDTLKKAGFSQIHVVELDIPWHKSKQRFIDTMDNNDRQGRGDNKGTVEEAVKVHHDRFHLHQHHKPKVLNVYRMAGAKIHPIDASLRFPKVRNAVLSALSVTLKLAV